MPYEYHNSENFYDSELKIIFHIDKITNKSPNFPHWHKSPELLIVTEGVLTLICDGVERNYNVGEMAIINNNKIHDMYTTGEQCCYFCLIIDNEIHNIYYEFLPYKSTNYEIVHIYKKIVEELTDKQLNYKQAVTGYIKVLFSLLSREDIKLKDTVTNTRKVKLVKSVTEYMYENFTKNITLEEISTKFNTSKYYLSHIFKEITGNTIFTHLNYIRCMHAKSLLKSGKYNVAESAYHSGYSNLSYFSRTYKNIVGNLPVKDLSNR